MPYIFCIAFIILGLIAFVVLPVTYIIYIALIVLGLIAVAAPLFKAEGRKDGSL